MAKNDNRIQVRIFVQSKLCSFLDYLAKKIGISRGSLIVLIITSYMKKEWEQETVHFIGGKAASSFWPESFKRQIRLVYNRYCKTKSGLLLFTDKPNKKFRSAYHLQPINFRIPRDIYNILSDNYCVAQYPHNPISRKIPVSAGLIQSLLLITQVKYEEKLRALPEIEESYLSYQRALGLPTSDVRNISKLALLLGVLPNNVNEDRITPTQPQDDVDSDWEALIPDDVSEDEETITPDDASTNSEALTPDKT